MGTNRAEYLVLNKEERRKKEEGAEEPDPAREVLMPYHVCCGCGWLLKKGVVLMGAMHRGSSPLGPQGPLVLLSSRTKEEDKDKPH